MEILNENLNYLKICKISVFSLHDFFAFYSIIFRPTQFLHNVLQRPHDRAVPPRTPEGSTYVETLIWGHQTNHE